MAKPAGTTAAASGKTLKKKTLQRKLEKAQISHQKAERKAGKLRVRLERAEVRLGQVAGQLVAMQALMEQASLSPKSHSNHRVPAKAESDAQVPTTKSASTTAKVNAANKPAANAAKAHTAKAGASAKSATKHKSGQAAQSGNGASPTT